MAKRIHLPSGALVVFAVLAAVVAAGLAPSAAQPKPPIRWTAPTAAVSGAAGSTIKVEVSAQIDEGWHLYALTQTPPPDPTRIVVADAQPFALAGKIEAPVPESGFDKAQGADTEYYVEAVTFKLPLSVARGTAPGRHVAKVKATWQACNGSLCLRPQTVTLDVPVQVTAAR